MPYAQVKDTISVLSSLPSAEKRTMPHIQLDQVDFFKPIPDEAIKELVEEQVADLPVLINEQGIQRFADLGQNQEKWRQLLVQVA